MMLDSSGRRAESWGTDRGVIVSDIAEMNSQGDRLIIFPHRFLSWLMCYSSF